MKKTIKETNNMALLIITIVFFFTPNLSFGAELKDAFPLETSQEYQGYPYLVYTITTKGDSSLSFQIRSSHVSTYLIVQSPSKEFYSREVYVDGSFSSLLDKDNAGITIEKAMRGTWIVIVASQDKNPGNFNLIIDEADTVKKTLKEELDENLIEQAFSEIGIYSQAKLNEFEKQKQVKEDEEKLRKINLLIDQLSLKSFRNQLINNLDMEINDEHEQYLLLKSQLDHNLIVEHDLQKLKADIEKLSYSNELLTTLLDKEIQSNDKQVVDLSNRLSEIVTRLEAYRIASKQIKEIDDITKELEYKKEVILEIHDGSSLTNARSEIAALQQKVKSISTEVAEKLFESSFARYLKLGINYHLLYNSRYGSLCFSTTTGHESGASSSDPTDNELTINPNVWLPKLFPWPPPIASSKIVLDNFFNWQHRFKSLGEADATIRLALDSTGYAGPSYFGVPNGFALVAQLEQIDGEGVPLKGVTRWSIEISEMKTFSLAEYIKSLLFSQPGYYRVIVFIVSSQPFSTSDDRTKFSTIQHWAYSGFSCLPPSVGSIEYSAEHRTTVLIYEFVKLASLDEPSTSIPGRHIAQIHLEKTKLLSYIQ
jgi:hypothetical protein